MIDHIPCLLAQGGTNVLPQAERGELITWIICAVAACVAINQLLPVVDRLRGRKAVQGVQVNPDPLRVEEYSPPVTQREFIDYKKDQELKTTQYRLEIAQQFGDLNRSREIAHNEIHAHINGVRDSILQSIKELDQRYYERLAEGNNRMIEHGEAIAAIKATMHKGGKP
jgi:hypothetical protein